MFYDVYADLCKRIGKKPSAVAEELKINKSNVSNWKNNGYTPRGEALQRIADYFGVTTDYLLGQESAPTAPARDILDEVDIAFYDGYKELSEDDKETVRDMVRVMRARRAKKQE